MTQTFEWATDANHPAGGDPWSGQPNKTAPTTTRREQGWPPEAQPTAGNLNYVLNEIGDVTADIDTVTDDHETRVTALETTVDTPTTGLSDRTDALETTVDTPTTGLTDRVGALETTVDTPTTGLSDRMDAAETDIDDLETTVDTPTTGLSDRMTAAESDIGDNETAIASLESNMRLTALTNWIEVDDNSMTGEVSHGMGIGYYGLFQFIDDDAVLVTSENGGSDDSRVPGHRFVLDKDMGTDYSWTKDKCEIASFQDGSTCRRVVVCSGAVDQVAGTNAETGGWFEFTDASLDSVIWRSVACARRDSIDNHWCIVGNADPSGDVVVKQKGEATLAAGTVWSSAGGDDPTLTLSGTGLIVRASYDSVDKNFLITDGTNFMRADDDVSLTALSTPTLSGGVVTDLAYDRKNSQWVGVTATGTRIFSDDNGASWTENTDALPLNPISGPQVYRIFSADVSTYDALVVVGSVGAPSESAMWVSVDGGSTWYSVYVRGENPSIPKAIAWTGDIFCAASSDGAIQTMWSPYF
jgi:hypothetical protein